MKSSVKSNNSENINVDDLPKLLALIELCEQMSTKYEMTNSFETAVKGLKRGLEKYYDRIMIGDEDVIDVQSYLKWFIKTALEYEAHIVNKDTKAWKWD